MGLRLAGNENQAGVDEMDKTLVPVARFQQAQSLSGEGQQHILVHLVDRRDSAGHQSGWLRDIRPPLCSLLR